MSRVIFIPEVRQYYKSLVPILYAEGYFSYKENARKYVKELVDDIKINLPVKLKRPAPKYFTDQYGKGLYYAVFPKNKRTQWYAFFRMYQENGELYYQVRHITNNHVAAQYFEYD